MKQNEKNPLLFLIMLSIILTACAKEDSDPEPSQLTEKEQKGDHKEFMPATDKYPNGYLDVVFGDVHIKIPSDYIAQNREDGDFFDLVVMYPSMQSGDEYVATGLSAVDKRTFDRSIRIMFEYKSSSFADHSEALKKFHERKWITQTRSSERYPGLIKYSQSAGLWFYKVDSRKYLTNSNHPIMFYCHAFGTKNNSPENLNDCIWHIHVGDTSIRVNLKQSHMRDWPTFITKVSTFLESLIVSGQPVVKIRGR